MAIKRAVLDQDNKSSKKKNDSPYLVADDIKETDGTIVYTKKEITDAIKNFVEGNTKEKEGAAMQETAKKFLGEFARRGFSRIWLAENVRPKSPKLVTNPEATGAIVTTIFMDKPRNLTHDEFTALKAYLGEEEANGLVDNYEEYHLNGKLAQEKVTIKGKSGSYMDHIIMACEKYFGDDPKIEAIFQPKVVRTTKKGMLDRLLGLAGKGPEAASRLANLILKTNVVTSYKAGSASSEESD